MINTQVLSVIVGSKAHGLATPNSDTDIRGVFVHPTEELLRLDSKQKNTSWEEGEIDNTSWEVAHFLKLALHSNPTILEVFLAPVLSATEVGQELRSLFPYVWGSERVRDSFIGYGLNQRKKFLDNKDNRAPKYAAAYARTLYNAYELLSTGTFTIKISDTEVGETVARFKAGKMSSGEVIDHCQFWEKRVNEAFDKNSSKKPDLEKIHTFLMKIRYKYFII